MEVVSDRQLRVGKVALYTQQTYVREGLGVGLRLWLTDMHICLCNCWVYENSWPYASRRWASCNADDVYLTVWQSGGSPYTREYAVNELQLFHFVLTVMSAYYELSFHLHPHRVPAHAVEPATRKFEALGLGKICELLLDDDRRAVYDEFSKQQCQSKHKCLLVKLYAVILLQSWKWWLAGLSQAM